MSKTRYMYPKSNKCIENTIHTFQKNILLKTQYKYPKHTPYSKYNTHVQNIIQTVVSSIGDGGTRTLYNFMALLAL